MLLWLSALVSIDAITLESLQTSYFYAPFPLPSPTFILLFPFQVLLLSSFSSFKSYFLCSFSPSKSYFYPPFPLPSPTFVLLFPFQVLLLSSFSPSKSYFSPPFKKILHGLPSVLLFHLHGSAWKPGTGSGPEFATVRRLAWKCRHSCSSLSHRC